MEINQQQVGDWLRNTLAASGPIAALIIARTGISQGEYALYMEVALAILPGAIVSAWGWYRNRKATQIKLVNALPEVAKVVIKNNVNGNIGALAQSDAHPTIVDETQNIRDIVKGESS